MAEPVGKVYLVGAGPGDPGLLTVRGKALLERADVVVHDGLVSESIVRLAARAETIFVGKAPGKHTLPQEDISRILVEQARRVSCVVRLKGGDPFVFGRGGEEIFVLAREGIPFEVVPGVTAGVAAPAYAGIPLTHRGTSSSITFITGHRGPEEESEVMRLDALHLEGTLVFYMGRRNLAAIAAELIRLGRPASTPAAAIEKGSTPEQRTVSGTLEDLASRCTEAKLESPVLIVIGEVVKFREQLAWFENRPLYGIRIAVTHARDRASELIRLLHERGAGVFEFPTIQVDRLEAPAPFEGLAGVDWIVLSSINGVEALFERMAEQDLDARSLHGIRLCAIGSKTAEAIQSRFLRIDCEPGRPDSRHVVEEIRRCAGSLKGKTFLLPRPDVAQSTLPEALRAEGAEVRELRAYRAAVPRDAEALAGALIDYDPHVVTFSSASAARNFHEVLGPERLEGLCKTAVFAAIGPIAAVQAKELSMETSIVPEVHRIPALVDAIVAWGALRS